MKCVVAGWLMLSAPLAFAQTPAASIESPADMSRQIHELRALVLKLQDRIDQLESHQPKPALESTPPPSVVPAQASSPAEPTSAQSGSPLSNLMAGTTISTTLDLYYQY